MPRHLEPKKDAASGETPRGAASRHRSGDFRMGEPTRGNTRVSSDEHIVSGGEPRELKHLSSARERKKRIDSLSSGERKGRSPNLTRKWQGLGPTVEVGEYSRRTDLERATKEGESPVVERGKLAGGDQSTTG